MPMMQYTPFTHPAYTVHDFSWQPTEDYPDLVRWHIRCVIDMWRECASGAVTAIPDSLSKLLQYYGYTVAGVLHDDGTTTVSIGGIIYIWHGQFRDEMPVPQYLQWLMDNHIEGSCCHEHLRFVEPEHENVYLYTELVTEYGSTTLYNSKELI